ncbi:hypothetical protein [Streptomyces sp. NBC_01216]|nr:hypothetical protein OG393_04025 [Streptomyces sp. NBC_01216]
MTTPDPTPPRPVERGTTTMPFLTGPRTPEGLPVVRLTVVARMVATS